MASEPSIARRAEHFARRDLLISGGLLVTGGALGAKARAGTAAPFPLQQAAPGAYVHQGVHEPALPSNLGHIANVGCVVGEEAVAVIDSGGSAMHGHRFRAAIQTITDLPIRYVIATHVHPDHLFGHAAFLQDEPTFVGHAKLPAALQARGGFYLDNLKEAFGDLARGTEVIMPGLLVEDMMALDLGNRRLVLQAHPTAHTDNDLSVFDHASGLFWAGDLLFMERCPVLDGRLLGWIDVLERLRDLEAIAVVPGHGPIRAAWPEAMAAESRYLTRLRDEVRAFLAAGGLLEDAVDAIRLDDERDHWQLFDEYHGRNVSAAFAELEWE